MDASIIVTRLAALAHETRLAIFRVLVPAGPQGLPAGAISERLGIPAPTLSFHLAQLTRAGLVVARQQGRYVIYTAHFAAIDELIAYLTENCCQGLACLPKTQTAMGKRRPILEKPSRLKEEACNDH
ncbi:MAG: metalloregulator ArsR/SmtB family transcription factor [Rhodocyclaceae bacterium]|nr:metalloregulator ArsR/SmtB family transcription factor [Rhodocyclaceae bacterium]